MVPDVLEKSVKLIRRSTSKGVINLNTNASKPDVIRRLFDAGMDSIRVSISSVRERYYKAYYVPRGYLFRDVVSSIKYAKKAGGFVSVNYLVMPGFTDSREEKEALFRFLGRTKVDMIQWRNLNFDPVRYWRIMNDAAKRSTPVGMQTVLGRVRRAFPELKFGYFNPPKEKFGI